MTKKPCLLVTLFLSIALFSFVSTHAYNSHPPKLSIVIVVDQFAHHYINKLYPHLKHGLKYLLDNGVVFTNAHTPHPNTGPSHATFNTGTYANDHGYVSNGWTDKYGKKVACDDDESPDTFVFDPTTHNTTYDFGKSSHYLMVDGLSDQCVMQSQPERAFNSISISGKSRSAIATASKLGKAIWFDSRSGLFTSSKAYFHELPTWLKSFNDAHNNRLLETITWSRMYPRSPSAYNFFNIDNYEYSRNKETMLDRFLPVPDTTNTKNQFHFFERTPQANKLILDLAQKCITVHTNRKTKDRLLLWVCLSPLDKVVHQYGPNSTEAIDMIYHLDKQLQKFIRFTLRAIGKHQVVFSLTADHGIMPIPEILHNDGLSIATKINQYDFIKELNENLKNTYNVDGLIDNYKGQELVFNKKALQQLTEEEQNAMMQDAKQAALDNPHMKHAWTLDELMNKTTHPNTLEHNIKSQLYKGRSGEIVLQPQPYTLVSHWQYGTSHKSPYDYDTHVPLILFHPGKFERKYVRERVTTLQLANTLAELLNIPKPSASTAEILPNLFDPEYQ
jgi:predicted AlkP superfamily pyrophosphatase or phosphodiesterase